MCSTFPCVFGRRRAPTGSVTTVGCSADDAADASPKQVALFSIGVGWTRSSPRTLLLPLSHPLAGWVVCRRRFLPSRWVSFHLRVQSDGLFHRGPHGWEGTLGFCAATLFFFFRFGWWWVCGPQRKGWKRPYLLGRSSPLPVPGVHQVVVDVSSPSIPPKVVLVSMGRKIPISFLFERKEPSFRFGFPSNPSSLPDVRGGGEGEVEQGQPHVSSSTRATVRLSLSLSLSHRGGRGGPYFGVVPWSTSGVFSSSPLVIHPSFVLGVCRPSHTSRRRTRVLIHHRPTWPPT